MAPTRLKGGILALYKVIVQEMGAECGSGFYKKSYLKSLSLLNLNTPIGTPKHQLNGHNF